MLSVHNIMVCHTGSRCSVKRIRELTAKELKHLRPEVYQVLAITSSWAVLDCLSPQSKTLEKAVSKRVKHTPCYEPLLTVGASGRV